MRCLDLSDVQVIIKTSYPGQAPQIGRKPVTHPLTTTMLSVPAQNRAGFSQFGDSYVYVGLEDGYTDLYWGLFPRAGISNQVQGNCLPV